MSRTVCRFRRARASMKSSTLESSSRSGAPHRLRLRHYLRCTTVVASSSRSVLCGLSFIVAVGMSSSNGQAFRKQRPDGSCLKIFAQSSPPSSSRTSCSSRGGVMLWSAKYTNAAAKLVAEGGPRQERTSARSPRRGVAVCSRQPSLQKFVSLCLLPSEKLGVCFIIL